MHADVADQVPQHLTQPGLVRVHQHHPLGRYRHGPLGLHLRFFDGVVIAASLTVVLSVLAAVTLLRALAMDGPERSEPSGLAARWW